LAKFVKPYIKSNKNDIIDAAAIAEAVSRPTMRFVAVRSAEQIDLQALHRVRDRLVAQRTRVICQDARLLPRVWHRDASGRGQSQS
jgi:transposase